jgi:hypothetical protein
VLIDQRLRLTTACYHLMIGCGTSNMNMKASLAPNISALNLRLGFHLTYVMTPSVARSARPGGRGGGYALLVHL